VSLAQEANTTIRKVLKVNDGKNEGIETELKTAIKKLLQGQKIIFPRSRRESDFGY